MTENRKIKNATSIEYKGIVFKSKLEAMAFKTLEENGFHPYYEPVTFELVEGFKPTVPFYIKDKKTRELKLNNKKVISIRYTPDFTIVYKGWRAYFELKGIENDTYYLKKKLFRKYLEECKEQFPYTMYFEVHTKRELLQAITIFKEHAENSPANSNTT